MLKSLDISEKVLYHSFMERIQIAEALKKARSNAGMKCKEVAAILGNSEKTVSAWENCIGQPDTATLFRLCEIYKISSIDELLGHISESNLVNTLRVEEKDLIGIYRQLNTNSKQIIMTLAQLELSHVQAVQQGETPIKILTKKAKQQMEAAIEFRLKGKSRAEKREFLKVYNQSSAAGYGNYIDDSSFEMVAVPSYPHGTEFGIRIQGDSMLPKICDRDIVFVKRQASLEAGEIGIFIYDGDAYCKQLGYKDGTYYLHSLNSRYKDIPILSDSIYTVGKVLDRYNEEDEEE